MKNRYVVQFETVSGKTFFIRHYDENGCLNCVTTNENKFFLFTNKATAKRAAKHFCSYVLDEYATYKIFML
jgi:hypothetical protein